MRPAGCTAVASMVSNAAPDRARWPRWITCQSVMHPSMAEYWHIGATTMRFFSSRAPTRKGVNSWLWLMDPAQKRWIVAPRALPLIVDGQGQGLLRAAFDDGALRRGAANLTDGRIDVKQPVRGHELGGAETHADRAGAGVR